MRVDDRYHLAPLACVRACVCVCVRVYVCACVSWCVHRYMLTNATHSHTQMHAKHARTYSARTHALLSALIISAGLGKSALFHVKYLRACVRACVRPCKCLHARAVCVLEHGRVCVRACVRAHSCACVRACMYVSLSACVRILLAIGVLDVEPQHVVRDVVLVEAFQTVPAMQRLCNGYATAMQRLGNGYATATNRRNGLCNGCAQPQHVGGIGSCVHEQRCNS